MVGPPYTLPSLCPEMPSRQIQQRGQVCRNTHIQAGARSRPPCLCVSLFLSLHTQTHTHLTIDAYHHLAMFVRQMTLNVIHLLQSGLSPPALLFY